MNPTAISRSAVCVATALLAACGSHDQPPPSTAMPIVTVLTVHRGDVPLSTELSGRTSACQVAQIRARVNGIVQQRGFAEGSEVKAQQSLYRIDPAPYQAAVASAQAALQKNQATLAATDSQLDRYRQLVGANAVSKQVFDNAVAAQAGAAAEVASARAALDTARINLGYTTVRSPISGRIATSLVTQGAYVQAGAATLMTTVEQLDPIYVDIEQSSADGLRLRRALSSGQLRADGAGAIKVTLKLEDGSTYERSGSLQFNGVAVDPATGSVTLRALFANPQRLLLPGMFVRASVSQGIDPGAVLVPAASVTRDRQGRATVLVVGADHKVVQREVRAGTLIGDHWVVDGGLADGEQLVVAGQQRLQPGMLVQTMPAAAQTRTAATAGGAQHG